MYEGINECCRVVPIDRKMDEQTDIGNCRVAFAAGK